MDRSSHAALQRMLSTSSSATAGLPLPKDLVRQVVPLEMWDKILHERGEQWYNLEELISHSEHARKFHCNFQLVARDNSGKSVSYISYLVIEKWLRKFRNDLNIQVDKEVNVIKNNLKPFLRTRPDMTILGANDIPLTEIEVHSSPYKRTLHKLILGLIDQLRFLRNCNSTILCCTGFAFPKYGESSCVTKMVVTWSNDELIFTVTYQPLTKDEVDVEVGEVVSNPPPPPNLQHPEVFHSIPLSPVTLCELNGSQVYSKVSIIIRTNDCYLKYNFNPSETSELLRLMLQASSRQIRDSVSRFLLPKKLEYIRGKAFFVYNTLIPPLRREEAIKCLGPFVRSVADAIHSLHVWICTSGR